MEVFTSKGEKIILGNNIGKPGGEGEVKEIISPTHYHNNCVKIYHEKNRTTKQEGKIRFMIDNKPNTANMPTHVNDTLRIGWPIETIYDTDKNFIGFMMPLAFPNSEKLSYLTGTRKLNGDWLRFIRKDGLTIRYMLMQNVAAFMYLLHHTGKYVLGDFKPDNVLVSSSGQVTIIDTDSIQITEERQLLFPITAQTPQYMPPEFYNGGILLRERTWDCFSLSVVFYELLLGLHPYAGVTPKFHRDENTFAANIRDDLFPFGSNTHKIEELPPQHPHKEFKKLPQNLQNLFIRSFSYNANQRPKVEEWSKCIREIFQGGGSISTSSQSQPFTLDPPTKASYIFTNQTNLNLDVNGSTKTITVTTDGSHYDVTNLPSWCSIVNKTATSFQIVCKPNDINKERNGKIIVKSGNITAEIAIEQEGLSIDVDTQPLIFDAKGATKKINVNTNFGSPNVTSLYSWCTVIDKKNGEYEIDCNANPDYAVRENSIIIKLGQVEKRIKVKQEKKTKPNWKLLTTIALILAGVVLGLYILFLKTPSSTPVASIVPDNTTNEVNIEPVPALEKTVKSDGVLINGVRWATRNVDAPGTFVSAPESAGMFYQWNRRRGWPATGNISGWNRSIPTGTTWTRENDPCPAGWRVPTQAELQSLFDSENVWTSKNGIYGRLFGSSQNTIFLPAAGNRDDVNGGLYNVGTHGYYYSSTATNSTNAWGKLFLSERRHDSNASRRYGYSIRCVCATDDNVDISVPVERTSVQRQTKPPPPPPPPPIPICGNCSINYSFGTYKGRTVNNIPDGQGTMTYTCRIKIAKHGNSTVYAESGDRFEGTWGNGDIANGKLYDSDNNQKTTILAGKRSSPYNLKNDSCE